MDFDRFDRSDRSDRSELASEIDKVANLIERRMGSLDNLSNTEALLYWNGLLLVRLTDVQLTITTAVGRSRNANFEVDMTTETPEIPEKPRRGRPRKTDGELG